MALTPTWRTIRVVGQLHRPPPCALRQVALRVGLHPPGDAFDEPLLVAAVGLFAEDHGVLSPQLVHGQRHRSLGSEEGQPAEHDSLDREACRLHGDLWGRVASVHGQRRQGVGQSGGLSIGKSAGRDCRLCRLARA